MNRTREITEAGLFAAILVLFIVGSFYIPILGNVMVFFLPLPIVILTMKNKIVNALIAAVIAGLISSTLVTVVYGLSMAAVAIGVGLPLGWMMKKKQPALNVVLIGGLGALVAFFLFFLLLDLTTGVSITEEIERSFTMSMDFQESFGQTMENLGAENVSETFEQSKATLEEMLYLMGLILPSLLIVFSMFYTLINMLMAHQILKRLRIDHRPLGSFANFTYPKHLAYGSAGMIVLAYLVGSTGWVDPVLLTANFSYLFFMIFAVQGSALIYFFMNKYFNKGLSRLMLAIILFIGGFQYIAFIGFFDVIFNIRKFGKQAG